MGGECSTHEKCIQNLVRNPEGRRPLRKYRHRLEDNIRMVGREIGWEVVDWIHLVQDRYQWQVLVNMMMNCQVP
jgi:hypothetical protein